MVLVVVFVAAVSMHMERLRGWGFLVLCFVVGSIGGLGFVWVKGRFQLAWNGLPKTRQAVLVGAAIAVVLVAAFILNYGSPDAAFNNFVTVGCIILALLLWACIDSYRAFLMPFGRTSLIGRNTDWMRIHANCCEIPLSPVTAFVPSLGDSEVFLDS